MFIGEIKADLKKITGEDVSLEHPADLNHGDYSTNIALVLAKKEKRNPGELADEIVKKWRETGLPDFVEKIEVAGVGFLNIWLKFDALVSQTLEVLKQKEVFGSSDFFKGKKILLEHTSPNPQTTIMLGHLRNNFLGMAVAKFLVFSGAKVTLDDVVNDRGVHICRSIWGYLFFGKKNSLTEKELSEFREISDEKLLDLSKDSDWKQKLEEWNSQPDLWQTPRELKLKPDHSNLIWYVLGSRVYKLSESVEHQVEEILQVWEKEDALVRKIWKKILDWSEAGYEETYKRVGSRHDQVWHESDHWKLGKEIVEEGLEKGVFRQSEGAIITNLESKGLSDNVVAKSDGTALYMTQDLALTKLKKGKFPSDLYIWDIGEEQTLYFKQLFAVVDQLGIIGKDKLFHLSYALIKFKGGGKMATRKGDVVMADETLDELHFRALEIIKNTNQQLRDKLSQEQLDVVAEKVAVGAIKYSLLKYGRQTTVFFDYEETLALQGDSGPYLQYTYARTQSVLTKSQIPNSKFQINPNFQNSNFSNEEISLLRTIYRFPEVVGEAAENYSPNLVCNFLYDLAQKFNLFYDKQRIIGSESEKFRLVLTCAVGQVLKNGLTLLGIEPLNRM